MSQDCRMPAFRSINDFLLDGTWNLPNFSDIERLNNRVINNLIYYQTNYLVLGISIILFVLLLFLRDFLIGLILFAVLFLAYGFTLRQRKSRSISHSTDHVKTIYSIVDLILILVALYIGWRFIYSFLILSLSVLLPILVILIHTILRKRNFANKIANKLDRTSLRKTPMGLFLDTINIYD